MYTAPRTAFTRTWVSETIWRSAFFPVAAVSTRSNVDRPGVVARHHLEVHRDVLVGRLAMVAGSAVTRELGIRRVGNRELDADHDRVVVARTELVCCVEPVLRILLVGHVVVDEARLVGVDRPGGGTGDLAASVLPASA